MKKLPCSKKKKLQNLYNTNMTVVPIIIGELDFTPNLFPKFERLEDRINIYNNRDNSTLEVFK